MMLEHLGHPGAAAHLQAAFESALRDGYGTRDVGGTSSTLEFTAADLARLFVDNLERYCSGRPLENVGDMALGFVPTPEPSLAN
ncbi:UNVERIFIED_ORG: hypothetical protein J2X79_003037 [Arthrobacter globiformis]|nr:hypothetical protein [Arthrobacter globiformis]